MLLSSSMTGKFVVSYGRLPVDLLYTYISSCLLGTLFLLSLVHTQCCNSPTRVNNLQILPQFFCVLNEFPHYGSYIINFPIPELFWQLGYMSPIRHVKLLECPCSVVIMGHHWDGCSSSSSIVHSLLLKSNLDHRHCRLDYHEFMELYTYVAPLECTWLKLENHNWIYFSSDKEHDKGLVQIMVTG